jgi:branched-chain amino acid transport system substrate-binding protein
VKKNLLLIPLALLLAISLVAIGCPAEETTTPTTTPSTTTPATTAPAEPIKIGAMLPLVGAHAMWGPWFERAHRFALDEVNWEVAGRPIELIVVDDGEYDPSVMMERLRKLVEVDKIEILFGPFCGPSRPVAYPYTSKIPMITINNVPAERGEIQSNYTFYGDQCYIDGNYHSGLYAAQELGFKTAATIGWDFGAAREFTEGWVDGFVEGGGTVVQQQWTEMAAADYTPYLTALEEADCMVSSALGAEAQMRILSQAYELGISQQYEGWFVLGTAEFEAEDVREQMGDRAVGAVCSGPWTESIDTPENKQFIEGYQAKLGVTPTCWDAMKYEETRLILAGLEATGGDTDPDKLKAAMMGLKLDLPSGPVSFDEGGVGIRNKYVLQVKKVDGEYCCAMVKMYTDTHTRAQIYPYP